MNRFIILILALLFSISSTYAQFVVDEPLKTKEDDLDTAIKLKDLKLGETAVGKPDFCQLGQDVYLYSSTLVYQENVPDFSILYEMKRELDGTVSMKFYQPKNSDISKEYADQLKKDFFSRFYQSNTCPDESDERLRLKSMNGMTKFTELRDMKFN